MKNPIFNWQQSLFWTVIAFICLTFFLLQGPVGCGFDNNCSSTNTSNGSTGSTGNGGNVYCDNSIHYGDTDCENASIELTQVNVSSVDATCINANDVRWIACDGAEVGKVNCDGKPKTINPSCGATIISVISNSCGLEESASTGS